MTQILSGVYRGMMFQASDRLLSRSDTYAPVDTRSNKALMIEARRSVAFLGYTGHAVMYTRGSRRTTTDTWIAGALTSAKPGEWNPATADNDLGDIDGGQLVERLVDHLQSYANRRSARDTSFSLEIQITGFLQRNMRAEPFVFIVGVDLRHGPEVYVEHQRMYAESLRNPALVATPGLNDIAWARTNSTLRSARSSPTDLMEAMMKSVRGIGSTRDGIGEDLMLLTFVPTDWELYIHFVRADGGTERVETGNGEFPVVYTPWFVLPRDVCSPKMVSHGRGRLGTPSFEIFYSAPESEVPGFVWVDHDRKPALTTGPRPLPRTTRSQTVMLSAGKYTLEIRGKHASR